MTARAAATKGSSSSSAKRKTVALSETPSDATVPQVSTIHSSAWYLRGDPVWTLTIRLAAVCSSRSRIAVRREATSLVEFLLEHVDVNVVDEAIGKCELMPPSKRPRRPRAILPGIRERCEGYGIFLPVWQPEESQPV